MIRNISDFTKTFESLVSESEKSELVISLTNKQDTFSPTGEFELSISRYYLLHSKNFLPSFIHLKTLLRIGNTYYFYKCYLEANDVIVKAVNLAKQHSYQEIIDLSYSILGLLHLQKGEYQLALEYVLLSQPIIESSKNESRISTFHNTLGVIYYHLGDLDSSLEQYLLSSSYFNADSIHSQYCTTLMNIATIYLQQSNLEKAREFALKAVEIANQLNIGLLQATTKSKLATIVAIQKELHFALDLANEIISYYEMNGPDLDLSFAYILRADLLREMNNPLDALTELNKALEIVLRCKNHNLEGSIMRSISLVFLNDLQKYESAYRYIQRYFEIYKDSEFKEHKFQSIYLLALYYFRLNDVKKAVYYISVALSDDAIHQWNLSKIAFLELLLDVNVFSSSFERASIEEQLKESKQLQSSV